MKEQQGSATILLVIAIGLMAGGLVFLNQSFRSVKDSRDFQRATAAYYAAEGGMQRAIAGIEKSAYSARDTGRLGDGLYEVSVKKEGEGYRVTARGYYHPSRVRNIKKAVAALRSKGGHYKNVIEASGVLSGGRFKLESFRKIPRRY